MVWANVSDVRRISGTSSTTFDDGELMAFIVLAQREVNSKISVKVIREKIGYIDRVRENKIDNSNTTYYVKNWKGNYFCDTNYDGEVDTSDINVYQVDSNGNETELTVSSINISSGSFVLSTAPLNVDLYVTYSYSSFDPENPDPLLSQCVTYLASSYMYVGDETNNVRFGNVSIGSGSDGSKYKQFYDKYQDLINQLSEISNNGGSVWGISEVRI
jgi:hypothetical protein